VNQQKSIRSDVIFHKTQQERRQRFHRRLTILITIWIVCTVFFAVIG
jgi:hypothetical protein